MIEVKDIDVTFKQVTQVEGTKHPCERLVLKINKKRYQLGWTTVFRTFFYPAYEEICPIETRVSPKNAFWVAVQRNPEAVLIKISTIHRAMRVEDTHRVKEIVAAAFNNTDAFLEKNELLLIGPSSTTTPHFRRITMVLSLAEDFKNGKWSGLERQLLDRLPGPLKFTCHETGSFLEIVYYPENKSDHIQQWDNLIDFNFSGDLNFDLEAAKSYHEKDIEPLVISEDQATLQAKSEINFDARMQVLQNGIESLRRELLKKSREVMQRK